MARNPENVTRPIAGDTLYAMELPPTGVWEDEAIPMDGPDVNKIYTFTGLAETKQYAIFKQATGSPLATDVAVWYLDRVHSATTITINQKAY